MLVFFDDELTTYRKKNYRFICKVKKSKKSFMECERDIGSMKNGHYCDKIILFESLELNTSG